MINPNSRKRVLFYQIIILLCRTDENPNITVDDQIPRYCYHANSYDLKLKNSIRHTTRYGKKTIFFDIKKYITADVWKQNKRLVGCFFYRNNKRIVLSALFNTRDNLIVRKCKILIFSFSTVVKFAKKINIILYILFNLVSFYCYSFVSCYIWKKNKKINFLIDIRRERITSQCVWYDIVILSWGKKMDQKLFRTLSHVTG